MHIRGDFGKYWNARPSETGMTNQSMATQPGLGQVEKTKRDLLILAHLPWVRAIALRLHETLPSHVDVDDLFHAGVLGLFDAADRYQPDKNVAFSNYAKHRIRGAIFDSLRQIDWAPRNLRRWCKRAEAVARQLSSSLNRLPTEAELEQQMGAAFQRSRHSVCEFRNEDLVFTSVRLAERQEPPAFDAVAGREPLPDAVYSRKELTTTLHRALDQLPPRHRRVVVLYYTQELTMKQIGTALGVHESRVSQMHKWALRKLARNLEAAGIRSSGLA